MRSGVLEPGMKGILITCNNNEKQCVREAYNLLNEYADNLYGPESEAYNVKNSDDFENDLANEIKALKSEKNVRRFQQVNTLVKNVLFIKTELPDPVNLVQEIYEDIVKTQCRKTRYILKMIPVAATCKTSVNAYKTAINELIEEVAKTENAKATYKVVCKVRHNRSISKDHIIWYCREAVEKHLQVWSPILTDPENVISVDILQSVCCIGILKKFLDYKKYNLSEVVPCISENVKVCDNDRKCKQLEKCDADTKALVTENKQNCDSSNSLEVKSEDHRDDVADNNEISIQKQDVEQDEQGVIDIFSVK